MVVADNAKFCSHPKAITGIQYGYTYHCPRHTYERRCRHCIYSIHASVSELATAAVDDAIELASIRSCGRTTAYDEYDVSNIGSHAHTSVGGSGRYRNTCDDGKWLQTAFARG